jgi:glycosyltransferase involved in cell wall biosynthesis
MRVLMLVLTSVATDTRVVREATTLVGAGHQVHIIGKEVPADYLPPAGVTVSSAGAASVFRRAGITATATTPTLPADEPGPAANPDVPSDDAEPGPADEVGPGRAQLPPHLRAARWALLPQHRNSAFRAWAKAAEVEAGAHEFDVVHAHDFNTLELGARLAAGRGVPLVYDSHELWSGRPRVGRPTPMQKAREARVEAELGGRAVAVITVGEAVAEALRHRYGWQHVTVVRNTFPLSAFTGDETSGEPAPQPTGAVYAGRIAPYRELETIIAAARRLPDLPVTLVGPADETYLAGLDLGPVSVRSSLPVDKVDALLRDAGIALVTHSNRWENHRLALPNKLFHAVKAGVPVVGTDVPELSRMVRRYGLGTLYQPGDADALASALRDVADRYPDFLAAVRAAAPELSWERDGAALLGVYDRLANA